MRAARRAAVILVAAIGLTLERAHRGRVCGDETVGVPALGRGPWRRMGGHQGTGRGRSFHKTGGPTWQLLATWPSDIATWTDINTPTESGSGPSYTTGDDDAAAFEGHEYAETGVTVTAALHRFVLTVTKDSDTSRFPEWQFRQTSNLWFFFVQLNTQTGATNVRSQSNVTGLTIDVVDNGSTWTVTCTFTPSGSVAANTKVSCLPAATTILGAAAAAATGTVTWVPAVQLEVFQ